MKALPVTDLRENLWNFRAVCLNSPLMGLLWLSIPLSNPSLVALLRPQQPDNLFGIDH
jgi:hypothetical protein